MQNLILFSLSALSQIVLCIIIYHAAKGDTDSSKTVLRRKFYLLGGASAFWCVSQYAYDVSNEIVYQERVLSVAVLATIWVAFVFLTFSRELIKYKIVTIHKAAEFLLALVASGVALFSQFAIVTVQDNVVSYEFNSLLYSFVTLVPLIFIVESIVGLERYAKKSRANPAESRQAKYVSRGMLLTTIFAFSGNFIFSLLGLDSTFIANFVVAIAPAIFTVSVGYAVFSLKLFNFRKFFFKVVIYGGVFTFIYSVLIIAALLVSDTFLQINELTLIVLMVPASLIAYSLARTVTHYILNAANANQGNEEAILDKEIQDTVRKIKTDEVLKGLVEVLSRRFLFDSVIIALNTGEKDRKMKQIIYPDPGSNIHRVKKLLASPSRNLIISKEELGKYSLNEFELGFVMKRGLIKGIILLGQKTNGQPIYDDERLILSRVSSQATLALENSLQYFHIQRFNEELEQKIDIATSELRHTNEKLKALDESKDEFISMASHQLRTPLTSVKGYVSMVLEGDAGELNEQQRKLLNQAFISSQRMVYLIADLLNVSRLRTGKFVIEAAPTYLPDVVEGELSQLYETAGAKNLKLLFNKPTEFPTLNLDETKIRQVIMNFADNAIYYTPSGGEINVALAATPSAVEFTVTDTGLGVPKKEQHHLFSKFYRAENAKKARPDGTGLGLFMAKKVVIAQGGAIIFSSKEGKGSTFGFTFPREGLEEKKDERQSSKD